MNESKTIRLAEGPSAFFKSAITTILTLTPSLAAGFFLIQNRVPLNAPYLVSCIVLALATIDFATVIIIEPYRRYLSKLTLPAFIGAMSVVLLFVMMDAANRFYEHLGYEALTPYVIGGVALIYAAIVLEKNILLKCLLSLNSIAVMFLWAMGAIDKITMPF